MHQERILESARGKLLHYRGFPVRLNPFDNYHSAGLEILLPAPGSCWRRTV